MVLTKQRYTYDEWIDSPLNTPRSELVNGEPVERMPSSPDHAAVVGELLEWVRRAARAGCGRSFAGPTGALLDPQGARGTAREPDAFFIRSERRHIVTSRVINGGPDLAIEVLSPSNQSDDLPGGAIWHDYERFGVPDYWIVDIETRTVAQYAWQGGRYRQPVLLGKGGLLQSPLFPGITKPLSELFVDGKRSRPLREEWAGRNAGLS